MRNTLNTLLALASLLALAFVAPGVASASTTFEAENYTPFTSGAVYSVVSSSTASNNAKLAMFNNSAVTIPISGQDPDDLTFAGHGPYCADPEGGEGNTYALFTFNRTPSSASTWNTFAVPTSLGTVQLDEQSGINGGAFESVTVQFVNDGQVWENGVKVCDRNLYIDYIQRP